MAATGRMICSDCPIIASPTHGGDFCKLSQSCTITSNCYQHTTFLLNCDAASMLADMLWRKLGLLPTDPGYGYFRPHVRLFDPGWRGPLVRGNRHEITADYGNDPVGIISR